MSEDEAGTAPKPAVAESRSLILHVEEIRDRLRARGTPVPGSPACPRPVSWGGTTLGGMMPVIAVATTGADAESCAAQALSARRAGADMVELRADLLTASTTGAAGVVAGQRRRQHALLEMADAWLTAARAVGEALRGSGIPVLFTVRTAGEGGGFDADDVTYRAALAGIATRLARERGGRVPNAETAGGAVAAIDVELARGDLPRLVRLARRAGVDVVASSHDFSAAPDDVELLRRLRAMQDAGAAVAKIAVAAADEAEVERLLGVAARARKELEIPVVAIAMGRLGAVSRLAGGVFGSALTFATAGSAASAPGQLPIADVRAARSALRRFSRPNSTPRRDRLI